MKKFEVLISKEIPNGKIEVELHPLRYRFNYGQKKMEIFDGRIIRFDNPENPEKELLGFKHNNDIYYFKDFIAGVILIIK